MILSDGQILEQMKSGTIVVKPFDRKCLGTNSYDVHLGPTIGIYQHHVLDAKQDHEVKYEEMDQETGYLLHPGTLYLASTVEYTETHAHVPFLEGKSSTGRLGINIHVTAGKGDVGYCNHWTLEICCVQPVRIYPYMPIGQLIYFDIDRESIICRYDEKPSAKYNKKDSRPVGSKMWCNLQQE